MLASCLLPLGLAAVAGCGPGCGSSGQVTTVDKVEGSNKGDEEPLIPRSRTPVALLEPEGVHHQEVLRLHQDFHPDDAYQIAVDAWVEEAKPDELALVRMWWVDTSKNDERSVFGKGVRRHIDITYIREERDLWTIAIKQGDSSFRFELELNPETGVVQAYGDVATDGGTLVERCPIQDSRLVARKFLGLPTGLDRLDVVCRTESGERHEGHLAAR